MTASALGRGTQAAEQLQAFIARIETVRAEKEALSDDEKAIFAEAKAAGFIPKAMRFVLKMRKLAPSEREEHELLRETYLNAMGMAAEPSLARAVGAMAVDVASRDQVMAALHKLVPANGSIEVEVEGQRVRLTRNHDGQVVETAVTARPPASPPVDLAARRRLRVVPDVDVAEAEAMGHQARKENKPITDNPFPWDPDKRNELRAAWERGWRADDGPGGSGRLH